MQTYGTTISTWTNSMGWWSGVGGFHWFVFIDGKSRRGIARTKRGAKSAVAQVSKRMAKPSS